MHMIIEDHIRINAEPSAVMAILKNPENWPSFVEKIESLSYTNDVYSGVIRMGKTRRFQFTGKIIDIIEPNDMNKIGRVELEISFRDEHHAHEQLATIVYQTMASPQGTDVREIIHYHNHINFVLWLLMKCIMIFGRKVEASNLDNLKALVEKTS